MSKGIGPVLIVHGGAWTIPDQAREECRGGCQRALETGWRAMAQGGTALDVVEAAVTVLEDEPIFDAGYGSHLNRDGHVQLDAIIMDGNNLGAGAIAAVERIRNPIRLARRVMEASPHMFLVAGGAEKFAQEQGMEFCRPEELVCDREHKLWEQGPGEGSADVNGTVGAVAVDKTGSIAAATSTGGTLRKFPGRVGDSPLIGCGCYADSEVGGVSCTGAGEAIMRVVLAKTAVELLRGGKDAQQVAEESVKLLGERGKGTGGLIVLDRLGRTGFAYSTPSMAYGYAMMEGLRVFA